MPINTKKIILDKFTELFRQKGIDRVSVRDVTEACGISRQTFYYHFRDILDVIEWGLVEKVDRIARAGAESGSIEEAVTTFVRFFSDDMPEINRLLDSSYRAEFQEMLCRGIGTYLEIYLTRLHPANHLNEGQRNFAVEFYADGICALLIRRAGKSAEEDEYLAEEIAQIIRGKRNLF